ncbi:MAG: response regulator, partial [Clostridia bacterium]|nr:response regulator [Clostridia bacterium]
ALNNAKLAYVAKNTFLSNMSHDMRTPLNAIFGFTALARKNADGNGKITDYIDKIENAGKQILELVDKVLEISYIETQDFHINEVKCNVCDIAKSIYDTVLPQAQSKNIDISLHLDKVEHGAVYADEERLAQILLQLAGNAVKFTGRGGKISLTVEEQKAVSGEFATFRYIMKDTGVGIGKQSLQRIFEPFEREYNTTSSGVYGSGLGLTIAKYVIDMMGGNIDIDSEVGKGSTFTVTISFRLQDEGSHSASKTDGAEVAQVDLQGREVLLVEDNEINREIAVELLEELGMRVDTAENGKAAVEMVKKNGGRYSFVLMYIQMPVMDGREAAQLIRKLSDPARAEIPIIAVSANAFESDKRLSLEAGINAHLTKPIDIPILLKAIGKIFRTES